MGATGIAAAETEATRMTPARGELIFILRAKVSLRRKRGIEYRPIYPDPNKEQPGRLRELAK